MIGLYAPIGKMRTKQKLHYSKIMTDRMDTSMDSPSFDFQSTHVSFEERRWLSKQRQLYKLDDLVQAVADLHRTLRYCQRGTIIPTHPSLIPKPSIPDNQLLYYSPSTTTGCTDSHIDQFRLHHQQLFLFTFDELCTNTNYRIFMLIMEGFIFYSSQTVEEYSSLFSHEIKRLLSSFKIYIQTRSSRMLDMLSILLKSSLPCYIIARTSQPNSKDTLFHLLPKFRYQLQPKMTFNSILAGDEYSGYVISLEELRYIDYSMHMKCKRHTQPALPSTRPTAPIPLFPMGASFGTGFGAVINNSGTFPSLHSLSIDYPYDDNSVYSQKYPSFWTGNDHTNENSNNLFHTISIEKNTPEYLFVQRSFNKTVSDKDVSIAFIERIQNPHLWEKFNSHRTYMRRKNGIDNLNENWLFHGTKSDHFHHIMSHGFNRSLCRDTVFYGRGVYFSRFAGYSRQYSEKNDLSSLFLCRVLVGHYTFGSNDIRVPSKITLANGKQVQADSTTDHTTPYTIVCTYHDDQNYPEYLITYINQGKRN